MQLAAANLQIGDWRREATCGEERTGVWPIKKLPQVGQEPVEAVESRPISPDGLYNIRKFAVTQRYFRKSGNYFD